MVIEMVFDVIAFAVFIHYRGMCSCCHFRGVTKVDVSVHKDFK